MSSSFHNLGSHIDSKTSLLFQVNLTLTCITTVLFSEYFYLLTSVFLFRESTRKTSAVIYNVR